MRKGPAIGATCLSLNLRRAARLVSRRYDEALRPLGVTVGQFSILSALLGRRGRTTTELAEVLGMDRTTLTRNLRPLRQRAFLDAIEDPKDRRSHTIALTPAGESLMAEAIPVWEKVQKQNLKRLNNGDWPALKSALDRLR